MKLKFIGFFLLSVWVLSGCSTTTSVSAMQSESTEIGSKKIDQLERKVRNLEARISALEKKFSGFGEADKAVIAGEGWKSLANWRKLKTGMSYDAVEKILGSAQNIDGGDIARWYYKNGGIVTFMDGRVYRWDEPR